VAGHRRGVAGIGEGARDRRLAAIIKPLARVGERAAFASNVRITPAGAGFADAGRRNCIRRSSRGFAASFSVSLITLASTVVQTRTRTGPSRPIYHRERCRPMGEPRPANVCNGSSPDRRRAPVAGGRERRFRVESGCGAVALGRSHLLPSLSSGGA